MSLDKLTPFATSGTKTDPDATPGLSASGWSALESPKSAHHNFLFNALINRVNSLIDASNFTIAEGHVIPATAIAFSTGHLNMVGLTRTFSGDPAGDFTLSVDPSVAWANTDEERHKVFFDWSIVSFQSAGAVNQVRLFSIFPLGTNQVRIRFTDDTDTPADPEEFRVTVRKRP